ncbi:MAG: DoxX family protein [Beijerinckiaceae bacterium]
MNAIETYLSPWQDRLLSVLRIVAGLLLLQHGLVKLFSFPGPFTRAVVTGELIWFAAIIELIGGLMLIAGFYTRWAAFICAGLMAFAYFLGHSGRSFYPILNGGNLAVLYCFVFLYIAAAGPGPWSLDANRSK